MLKPPSLVDPARDRAERLDAAAKVVADLNKTFSGWTFTLPQYAFSNFTKTLEDLLKPLDQKPAAAAKAGGLQLPGPAGRTLPPARPVPAH